MATVKRSNPKAFKTLALRLQDLDSHQSKAGWFASAKYSNGTPVAYVAAIQELGSPRNSIPPRPFIRTTFDEKQQKWLDDAAKGANAVLQGKLTAADVMGQLAAQAVGDIRRTISQLTSPPLSKITIYLRWLKLQGRIITGKTVGEAAFAVSQPNYVQPNVSVKPLVEPGVDGGILIATMTHTVEEV